MAYFGRIADDVSGVADNISNLISDLIPFRSRRRRRSNQIDPTILALLDELSRQRRGVIGLPNGLEAAPMALAGPTAAQMASSMGGMGGYGRM